MFLLAARQDEEDLSEYPDDFEVVEADDVAEVVSSARSAMEVKALDDVFEEELQYKAGASVSATIKSLKEKCVGKKVIPPLIIILILK